MADGCVLSGVDETGLTGAEDFVLAPTPTEEEDVLELSVFLFFLGFRDEDLAAAAELLSSSSESESRLLLLLLCLFLSEETFFFFFWTDFLGLFTRVPETSCSVSSSDESKIMLRALSPPPAVPDLEEAAPLFVGLRPPPAPLALLDLDLTGETSFWRGGF